MGLSYLERYSYTVEPVAVYLYVLTTIQLREALASALSSA